MATKPKRSKLRQVYDAQMTRMQAEAHAEAAGVYEGRRQPKRHDKATLRRCGKAAYGSFVKEAGYEHDARVCEWEGLKPIHHQRWTAIARAVLDEAGQ